jgi:hypothetical protein
MLAVTSNENILETQKSHKKCNFLSDLTEIKETVTEDGCLEVLRLEPCDRQQNSVHADHSAGFGERRR